MEILKKEAKVKNAERIRKDIVGDLEEPKEKRRKEDPGAEGLSAESTGAEGKEGRGSSDDHLKKKGIKRGGDDIDEMNQERPMSEQEIEKKELKRDREEDPVGFKPKLGRSDESEEPVDTNPLRWW